MDEGETGRTGATNGRYREGSVDDAGVVSVRRKLVTKLRRWEREGKLPANGRDLTITGVVAHAWTGRELDCGLMYLQGGSSRTIGSRVGLHQSNVNRALNRIQARMLDADEEEEG